MVKPGSIIQSNYAPDFLEKNGKVEYIQEFEIDSSKLPISEDIQIWTNHAYYSLVRNKNGIVLEEMIIRQRYHDGFQWKDEVHEAEVIGNSYTYSYRYSIGLFKDKNLPFSPSGNKVVNNIPSTYVDHFTWKIDEHNSLIFRENEVVLVINGEVKVSQRVDRKGIGESKIKGF